MQVINKFTIEEPWYLVNTNFNNHFTEIVKLKLNQILDYYQKINMDDFLKKKNEEKDTLRLIK